MKYIYFLLIFLLVGCIPEEKNKMYIVNQKIEKICKKEDRLLIITKKLKMEILYSFFDKIYNHWESVFIKNNNYDITISYKDINHLYIDEVDNQYRIGRQMVLTRGNFLGTKCEAF